MRDFKSSLSPIIKEYLRHRNTLGYSNHDEELLIGFDTYCLKYHSTLESLTRESVRGWIKHEIAEGRRGISKKAIAIRNLAKYIGNGAYTLPVKIAPKEPKYIPYILTDDELSRLFIAADNMKGRTNTSLKVIIPTLFRLLYTCGLRPHEVRLIKRDNIDFVTGEIFIEKTKGHKGHTERIVVMSDDMLGQCRRYDAIRVVGNQQSEYFFARPDGNPLSNEQLIDLLKRCWKQANPDVSENMLPRIRPYDLRHRFASTVLQKWLNEGCDFYSMLPYLRAYMGHKELSATAYYIHLLPEHLLGSASVDWSAIDTINPEVDIWKS